MRSNVFKLCFFLSFLIAPLLGFYLSYLMGWFVSAIPDIWAWPPQARMLFIIFGCLVTFVIFICLQSLLDEVAKW